MTDLFSNDNSATAATAGHQPDAYGQAALFLVESLLHGLIEEQVISVAKAVEVVDTAVEVKREAGPDLGDSPRTLQRSLALLAAISTSLQSERGS